MSDTFETFSFRTVPTPLHRRVRPRVLKAIVAGAILVLLVMTFARWVIHSERASFRALARHESPPPIVGTLHGIGTATAPASSSLTTPEDLQARRVAHEVLSAARHLSAHGSFSAAGTSALARLLPAYTFVVGPSPTPQIVSVAATAHGWAAAVAASTGRCFMIRAVAAGPVRYGSSVTGCSAVAALHVEGATW
jgi:hypothetical protein